MRRVADQRPIRCAIYTRKSTEDGLEQAFNSLDAQREACAAYITSQCHEGWTLVPEHYDDGGISGGSMDRPALRCLLADVRAGRVDVIVVYKVDRLTRSLTDFARIVEILDAHEASFVSVTQAFNTTSSMGRLTLNVLLSFAQFEREVTGERIRDKIAASKVRGMWMGGNVPLGYEVVDRKLVVVSEDADTVRMIFERYLELGSVLALQAELAERGVRSRVRASRAGKCYGDKPFSRGALYHMLKNRMYLGEVGHKGAWYPGEHEAIVEAGLFEQVASLLEQNRTGYSTQSNAKTPSLLTGLVWDGEGRRMSPDHCCKGERRYRYYASRIEPMERGKPAWRVPASDLEALVLAQLCRRLDRQPSSQAERRQMVIDHVERITVDVDRIDIMVRGQEDQANRTMSITASLVRRGKEKRLAIAPDQSTGLMARRDPALIKLVVKAHMARQALSDAQDRSIADLAKEHGLSRDYFGVLLRISYLAPDIVTAILDGRQPARLNRQRLARLTSLPINWRQQREVLGFV